MTYPQSKTALQLSLVSRLSVDFFESLYNLVSVGDENAIIDLSPGWFSPLITAVKKSIPYIAIDLNKNRAEYLSANDHQVLSEYKELFSSQQQLKGKTNQAISQ